MSASVHSSLTLGFVKYQDATDYQKQDWNYQENLIQAVCSYECTSVKRQQYFDDGCNCQHKAKSKTDEQKANLSFVQGPFPYFVSATFSIPSHAETLSHI